MVADNESGKSVMSEVRTSSGMFLNKAQVCWTKMVYFMLMWKPAMLFIWLIMMVKFFFFNFMAVILLEHIMFINDARLREML